MDIARKIINGMRLKRGDNLEFLLTSNLKELCFGANLIRDNLCGNSIELCSIINGRKGNCMEDCKFCAQSKSNKIAIEEYGLLDEDIIVEDCIKHSIKGVHRYSIVTSGRGLSSSDLDKLSRVYMKMKENSNIELCASHGLLRKKEFQKLRESGVTRYHENIETSKRYFKEICTTHTYEDKIKSIKEAKEAGLSICSGGIIGMEEDFQDRIDMAVSLSELKVESIPINVLIPIEGTALKKQEKLSEEDILRTIAIFRFINPTAKIRLAAGRNAMKDCGERAFMSGANATITGDLLTTSGNNIDDDIKMIKKLGFSL